jgi:hypothetical protein
MSEPIPAQRSRPRGQWIFAGLFLGAAFVLVTSSLFSFAFAAFVIAVAFGFLAAKAKEADEDPPD